MGEDSKQGKGACAAMQTSGLAFLVSPGALLRAISEAALRTSFGIFECCYPRTNILRQTWWQRRGRRVHNNVDGESIPRVKRRDDAVDSGTMQANPRPCCSKMCATSAPEDAAGAADLATLAGPSASKTPTSESECAYDETHFRNTSSLNEIESELADTIL